jgi:uncharacterized protein involved in cysteine biosynthesis
MDRVIKAFFDAARNLFHPGVFGVLLFPMVVALVVWFGLGWWFWDSWLAAIRDAVVAAAEGWWFGPLDLSAFAGAAAVLLLILLILPAILVTAMLIAAVFAMPVLVELVARRDYPGLERRKGGTTIGGAWNALAALVAFLVLWIGTLPLWLIVGPLAAPLPWLLSAYLNQGLFRYDALSEHASAEEMRTLFEARFGGLFVLGLLTGALYFVPLVNLVAPTFSALAFIHYCLAELQRLRASPASGQP